MTFLWVVGGQNTNQPTATTTDFDIARELPTFKTSDLRISSATATSSLKRYGQEITEALEAFNSTPGISEGEYLIAYVETGSTESIDAIRQSALRYKHLWTDLRDTEVPDSVAAQHLLVLNQLGIVTDLIAAMAAVDKNTEAALAAGQKLFAAKLEFLTQLEILQRQFLPFYP